MTEYTPSEEALELAWIEFQAGAEDADSAAEGFERGVEQIRRLAARAALDGLAVTYRDVSTLGILQYRDTHYPEGEGGKP